jgi:hypothetical protein
VQPPLSSSLVSGLLMAHPSGEDTGDTDEPAAPKVANDPDAPAAGPVAQLDSEPAPATMAAPDERLASLPEGTADQRPTGEAEVIAEKGVTVARGEQADASADSADLGLTLVLAAFWGTTTEEAERRRREQP